MLVIAGSHRSKRRGTKRLRNIHIAVAILGSLPCLDRAAAAESGPDKRPTLRVPLTAACSYNECTPPWGDRTWQPRFKFAAAAGTGEWAAEFALPLNIFLKNKTLASQIGFNIRRSGMPGEETHCWQGTPENPGEWGVLTGIPARDSLPGPDYSTRGLNRKGELYVLSDTRPVRGVAELRVFDRRGKYLRTIMPLNPTLPRSSVRDLCRKTAREAGTELVIPKLFQPWGERSMYGDWWHHPQKIALAPGGDLIMSNIYRGTLWRMRPDGGLPLEGWTSFYHRGRNEPFESTVWTQEFWHCFELKNYMPFHALHYPYFCFDPGGLLYVSAGQSSRPTKQYAYHFEVGENDVNYHWEMSGKEGRGWRLFWGEPAASSSSFTRTENQNGESGRRSAQPGRCNGRRSRRSPHPWA